MRIIALPARPAGPRWWRLAHARGGAAPRGRPDDGWIEDASRVARDSYPTIYRPDEHTPSTYLNLLPTYLSTYLSTYLPTYLFDTVRLVRQLAFFMCLC